MKVLKKSLDKDQSGFIVLVPQDSEDIWHVYNLVQVGDEIEALTIRKVSKVAGGGNTSTRKLLKLRAKVTSVEFDPQGSSLRIRGPIINDVEDVSAGTFHTFTLELERNFLLYKQEWDSIALNIIDEACDPENKAEVGAVVMEEGMANICLITSNVTLLRQRVEASIPRKKRGDNSGYEKGLRRFYQTVMDTMLRNLTISKLKAILIASPGFTAKGFYDYMFEQATNNDNKDLVKSKSKFLVTHSSTGHVHALNEILKNPDVQKQLSETKYARETMIMDQFFKMLNEDDMRAWYGPKVVEAAVEKGAVQTLMITDSLFRSNDIQTRRNYISLVETVRGQGGSEAIIFSSMHESGKQLDQLTGIACILTYPLPELEDVGESGSGSDSDS